jgi:hypothetical protein
MGRATTERRMNLFEQMPEQRKAMRPLGLEDFHDAGDGEPRVPDWRLAECLMLDNRWFHQLIERHRQDLEDFGTLLHRTTKSSGGRPGSEYLLNFNQAIFIINRSEAPNARPIQKHVVIIYGLWATGKLKPVDQASALVVADATIEAYQQSPEMVGMLQMLLARVAELDASHGDRIASVQRTALEIQERLGEIVKRRPAPTRNQDIYDHVVRDFYLGRCPCCRRPDRIIIDDQERRTARYALDHATDNPYKNGLHEMWPVCRECNGKLTHDARYRAEMTDRFRVFQSHVEEIKGERLI